MNRCSKSGGWSGVCALLALLVVGGSPSSAYAQGFDLAGPYKNGQPLKALMSPTGFAALRARAAATGIGILARPKFPDPKNPANLSPNPKRGDGGGHYDGGPGRRNVFVNDPCLDPPPEYPFPSNFYNTVQSETDIAVLNRAGGDQDDHGQNEVRSGRLMVAGYNDSRGFGNNREGLSGFSYSTNGGKLWIDAGGLPPIVAAGLPPGAPGQDHYFGDPVLVVHHRTQLFYYASIYLTSAGYFTISVNRGRFRVAPQQVPVESRANTRCLGNPALNGIPDPPPFYQERVIWAPPVEAVRPPFLGLDNGDFLDKEWLHVDQKTGFLYLTYTRFTPDESTPLELVRSFDQGRTWTPPTVIVPNLLDTFNQATMPVVTPTRRVIVAWVANRLIPEAEDRIETAISDNCAGPASPCTFSRPIIVDIVRPQGEPLGYNRGGFTMFNPPYINVDLGRDDGVFTRDERRRRGFGNVYITYFDGKTPSTTPIPDDCPGAQAPCNPFARAANILLSVSTNNGTSYRAPIKVNDDAGKTSHVFPSVQVNQFGKVFVTWIDRRKDRQYNILNDTWGEVSDGSSPGRGRDVRITDVSTDWYTREDAEPDFGDYNSSEVINFTDFVSIWADGRFPPGTFLLDVDGPEGKEEPFVFRRATPDVLFSTLRGGDEHDDGEKSEGR